MSDNIIKRKDGVQYAYIVAKSIDPKYPKGKVLLMDTRCGKPYWKPERFVPEGLLFENYMTCKFLGKVYAKTTDGKIRRVNALAGRQVIKPRSGSHGD